MDSLSRWQMKKKGINFYLSLMRETNWLLIWVTQWGKRWRVTRWSKFHKSNHMITSHIMQGSPLLNKPHGMPSARHRIPLVCLGLDVSDIFNTQQNRIRKLVRFIPPAYLPQFSYYLHLHNIWMFYVKHSLCRTWSSLRETNSVKNGSCKVLGVLVRQSVE